MHLRRLALAGAFALSLLHCSPASAAGWLAPTDLSVAGRDAAQLQSAMNAAGDAVVVWRHFKGSESTIEASVRPASRSFSGPIRLSAEGGNCSEPQVALDARGDTIVVWHNVAGGVEADFRRAGGAFGDPKQVSGSNGSEPQVAVNDAGQGIAVWVVNNGTGTVEAAPLSVSNEGVSPRVMLSESPFVFQPDVAIDPAGDVVAIWAASGQAANQNVIKSSSRTGGGPFSTAVPISAEGKEIRFTSISIDDGGAAVAIWERFDQTDESIVEVASGSAGGPFLSTPLSELATPLSRSLQQPQVALNPAGNAAAVWRNTTTGAFGIEGAFQPAGILQFSAGTPVSPESGVAEPDIALDPAGNAVAVWSGADGSIEAAARPSGGSSSSPVKILAGGQSAKEPRIALDAAGDGIAAWSHSDGTDRLAQAALYDATGPLLGALSIPTTGTAGKRLSFSASPVDALTGQASARWDFGDRTSPSSGAAVTHTYATPGHYPLTLTATDTVGNATSAKATVTIKPAPSKARVGRLVKLRGGKALVSLSCPAGGPCQGTAKLSAKHGGKRLALGKRSFQIAAGKKLMLAIKLSAAAQLLIDAAGRKGLLAKLEGDGVQPATVRLGGGSR